MTLRSFKTWNGLTYKASSLWKTADTADSAEADADADDADDAADDSDDVA